MNRLVGLIGLGLCLIAAGCRTPAGRDTVTQVATIDALLAGAYDGHLTLRELLRHGDFGIGTFDRLDGEMLVLNGLVYQVRADGQVLLPPPTMTTPFAAVTHFVPDLRRSLSGPTDYAGLQAIWDAMCANSNLPHAVRAQGHFSFVRTRSVPAQTPPYPPLREVTRRQPEFVAKHVAGTLVGFRLPAYVSGINVPGYHLHFISDDRSFGGHLLECVIEQGELEIDTGNRLVLILPSAELFGSLDLSLDRTEALHEVER